MATHIEQPPRVIVPRASRRNEILAILLLAVGSLLALCLVSAAFYPNDPSWNSAGAGETHNWAGAIGANVAATAFQFIGLASFLLPLLLFAAAWRRFRPSTIHHAWTRIAGLTILVIAASALLSISHLHPLFDASMQPGGLLGAVISQGLASGFSNVGATVLLVAIAASGLLLATNISFVRLYEIMINAISTRFAFVGKLPERFRAWRQMRAENARVKRETKAAIKAERDAAKSTLKQTLNLTPAERVADFMKEPVAPIAEQPAVIRNETSWVVNEPQGNAAAAAAGVGVAAPASPGRRRTITPEPDLADDEDDTTEMVKGASVLRTKTEAPATGKLPFDASRRVDYNDYG